MPTTAQKLVEKSKDQRKRLRYEEALVSSIAATESSPDNAEAWWQVALNRLSLADTRSAVPALQRTVDLAPHFALGWARLGTALLKTGDKGSAQEAFERTLKEDPDQKEALEALADIYYRQNKDGREADDQELSVLTRLEDVTGLSSFQLIRVGALHYRKKNFFEAIKYWERDAATSDDPASLFNLGLTYHQSEVSQDADAIDLWRLTEQRFPDFKRSRECITKALPGLLTLASNVRAQGSTLLREDQWYRYYVNPFELLNHPEKAQLDALDAKAIQRLRKALLQEIEVEEGVISWLPGVRTDKSKAIGVCEELNDASTREFHWHVFQNKPLLHFLSRGSHEHFLVDETNSPLAMIELLEDEDSGFREWLSEPFAKQFALVLSKAIDQQNVVVLECLLDGRRWVSPSFADRCFENARRQVDRLLEPLRNAHQRADEITPTVESVTRLLEQGALVAILNLLPTYFRDLQNDAVSLIRGIAISCYNRHSNSDLSRNILAIARRFRFKSAELNQRLDEDFRQVEEFIRQERKHEVRLLRGNDKWEITKEGVFQGAQHIPTSTVASVLWGAIITQESYGKIYDFLLVVKAADGSEIRFAWKAAKDLEKNQEQFTNLINAALNYLFPTIAERIENRLKAGQTVQIGPCMITERGVQFETKGWIFADKHFVPWPRVRLDVENGDLTVADVDSRKARIAMSLRETDNAPVLRLLAHVRNPD